MQTNSVISFIGDVGVNGLLLAEPQNNEKRFAEPKEILKESGLVFSNLETPIIGEKPNPLKANENGIIYFTEEEACAKVLKLLNISVVSIANNHIFDFEESGVKNTINFLKKNKIRYTGAGFEPEDWEPIFIDFAGKRISFIAYVHPNTNPKVRENTKVRVNLFDEEKIIDDITKAKNNSDLVILSLHWGVDYSFYFTKYQKEICERFSNAGLDILLGHHPHTLQPIEKVGRTNVFYSLGTFCDGDFIDEKTGKLKSLQIKSKTSAIVNYDLTDSSVNVFPTKKLPGNKIEIVKKDYQKSNKRKVFISNLVNRYKIINATVQFKESIIDRVYDYFFGYYRNFWEQLFSVSNILKLKNILSEFNDRKKMLRDEKKDD